MQITNQFSALVQALELAITAPTDEKAQECSAMAEQFAAGFNDLEIAKAKKLALQNVNDSEVSE